MVYHVLVPNSTDSRPCAYIENSADEQLIPLDRINDTFSYISIS